MKTCYILVDPNTQEVVAIISDRCDLKPYQVDFEKLQLIIKRFPHDFPTGIKLYQHIRVGKKLPERN